MAKSTRRFVDHEFLREILRYDPATGVFTWKVQRRWSHPVGSVAGSPGEEGAWLIGIQGVVYRAHQLAWFYVRGTWPEFEIDHKDGNRSNNAFDNLRDVPHVENCQNVLRPLRNNTTGFLGVTRQHGKFKAQIGRNGKSSYIGLFDTAEAAHEAYLAAKRSEHKGNLL